MCIIMYNITQTLEVFMYIVMYRSTQRVEVSYVHCNVQQYTESGGFLFAL
jgi:hypothetical protein